MLEPMDTRYNIQLGVIYRLRPLTVFDKMFLDITGGQGSVYTSSRLKIVPSSLADMELSELDQKRRGHCKFISPPTYICIVEYSGTITEIVLGNIEPIWVGKI